MLALHISSNEPCTKNEGFVALAESVGQHLEFMDITFEAHSSCGAVSVWVS